MPARRFHPLVALLAATASGLAAAPPAVVGRQLTLPVALSFDRFVLPNGLTVVVHTDRSVPDVFVGLWYKVGAKDEPVGQTGFAHLFEHLMFQPTPHRPGDFMLPMQDAGATNVNGMTTGDFTTFHETLPSGALDRALWLESDRMGYLADGIDQAALDRQRGVVKNEKRQGELAPGAYTRARLLAGVFPPGHPYAHPPIGSMADLDRATLPQVKRWFADYYGARNAVLVLSGDIDLPTAKREVARYFADVPAGRLPPAPAPWAPDLTAVKKETIHDAIPGATLLRTWAVPSGSPRATALLQLIAATLVGSRDAPLQKALVEGDGPALGVSAGMDDQQLVGTFTISVALRPGASPERASRLLDEALARYRATGPDPQRLGSVLLMAETQLLASLESAAAIGQQLGAGEASHGDPAFVLRQRQWYAGATAGDLRRLADQWLGRPYYQLTALPGTPDAPIAEPAGPAPSGSSAQVATSDADPATAATIGRGGVDRTRMPAVGPLDGRVAFPAITTMMLPNGLRLVVAPRHRLPMVRLAMTFPTGTLADPAGMPGLARQAFAGLGAGTTQRDEVALERAAGAAGVTFASNVGPLSSSFAWTTLTDRLDQSFALTADVLRHPAYPQAWLDRETASADAEFDAYERSPQAAAPALLARALWGNEHPAGRIARRDQARSITRAALLSFHDRAIVPQGATLYVFGDIAPARARALTERYFGGWHGAARIVAPPAAAPAPSPRVILVDAPGAQQSAIAAGELVAPFDRRRSTAEHLADAVLASAFSGRLNDDLRQTRGWSYGMSGGIADVPAGERVFSMRGTVQTDRTAQSMELIRRDVADVAGTRPITPAEFDAARTSAVRASPEALATSGGMMAAVGIADSFGLPPTYAAGAGERLAGTTLEQVRAAAAVYRPADLTWVVVGDLSRIEKEVRALNLGPVEVWDVYGRRLR